MVQHLNRERGRGSKTEEPDAFSWLGLCNPKAAKADNPGTQERRKVLRLHIVGQRISKIGAHKRVFRITAIHAVAGKGESIAEILFAAPAERACAVDASDPRHTGTRTQRKLFRRALDDLADDLVAGNERVPQRRQIALKDMQVGPADSTGEHTEKSMTWRDDGTRDLLDQE
jgi:hypothetical protein